ncbi:MAG TPA: type II secretion system protein [Candidatus Saccharimonadales bacterium]|nr:type II secretion system protein [Candidatus Saccharimonadales bacterium]
MGQRPTRRGAADEGLPKVLSALPVTALLGAAATPRRVSREVGATLVEVLVAIALTGIMLPTLATALITAHAGRANSRQQIAATALLHEATEAVRMVRDESWNNLATNGTFHPVISGTTWALASGSESLSGFTRQIVISDATRDGSGALVASGGTADPSTKHVAVTVAWTTPYNSSISSDSYLTRWSGNAIWQQTSVSDFAAGSTSSTVVSATGGGQVELAGAPSYQTAGDFTSQTFDAGVSVAFNYLDFTASRPANTTLGFQVAVNSDNATWNYVGPDGTSSTYFSAPAALPLGTTDRYLRFKAVLTGDGSVTPVVSDVTVSYTP